MPLRGRSTFRPRRGRGFFSPRGSGGYSDRRNSDFPNTSNYDSMPRRSRDFNPSYGHKSEMTKAMVMESGNTGGIRSSSYKHPSRSYHSQDFEHERKKFNYKDSDRSMRDSRTESRRYPKEHREEHYDRPSINSKGSYKYVERKSNFDDFHAPSIKRQRTDKDGSFRESKFSMNREPIHRESRSHFKPYQRFPRMVSSFPRGMNSKRDYQRFPIKTSGRLNFNSERMLPFRRDRSSSRDGRPLKVTIKSSGRRRIDGNQFHAHGGSHVELKCPHCPGFEAMTFKDYRYHLDTTSHGNNLNKLIHKHSAVLRKIRMQQRDDQREVEADVNKEDPEKYRSAEKDFCGFCKLVYKIFSNDSQSDHNNSRFHKMQVQYLRPYCKLCKINFPSLMVYEHHIASIRHLRSICERKISKNEHIDEGANDFVEENEDFDMSNFITMDAVGEDDCTSMSDNEEITGNLEEVEAAIEETKGDFEESVDRSELNSSALHDEDDKQSEECDPEDIIGDEKNEDELLVEDYHSEDEHDLADESVGTEYLCAIDAMLCRLCGVAVRTDYLGDEALERHCKSTDHINRYNEIMEKKSNEGIDSKESNNDLTESPDVDQELEESNIEKHSSHSGEDEELLME